MNIRYVLSSQCIAIGQKRPPRESGTIYGSDRDATNNRSTLLSKSLTGDRAKYVLSSSGLDQDCGDW